MDKKCIIGVTWHLTLTRTNPEIQREWIKKCNIGVTWNLTLTRTNAEILK